MNILKGACVIGQSGGPTSVINSSVLGCIESALASDNVTKVYAASHGIEGILNDELFDLTLEDPEELRKLKYTPSAFFGSCRYKIKDYTEDETDYLRILEIFKKYNIRYFFYNGGNDSMDTCKKVNEYMQSKGYECAVIGIPKTIDNDLALTDHCPGYGSAAKYVAQTFMEIKHDAEVYGKGSVTIVEVMGRNAGWLTAAATLADIKGMGPDLVYLPEVDFDLTSFMADVKNIYNKKKNVLVAVSEGIHDSKGNFIISSFTDADKNKDAFGHAKMGGLAVNLAEYIKKEIDASVRAIEFSILQRCAAHIASQTDIDEAYMAGKHAFLNAEAGVTGKMIGFLRDDSDQYKCIPTVVALEDVANVEKKIPRNWINEEGNGVLQPFIDYALPLIQGETCRQTKDGLTEFAQLKLKLA